MKKNKNKTFTLLLEVSKRGCPVEMVFKSFKELLAYCEWKHIEVTVGDVRIEP